MTHSIANELSQLVNVLGGESDRGLALAGAAMLDDALEALIRARIVNEPKVVNAMIGLDRPIGTFSSRIKVAYLFGLLEESEFRDLELIRKIRNDCAHNRSDVNLSNSPHKERIAELSAQKEAGGLLSTFFGENFTDKGQLPRNQLLIAISFLGVWLIYRSEMVKRSTVPDFSETKRRAVEVAKEQNGVA